MSGQIGVIDVALLEIIRRWRLRAQVPLREIAKGSASRETPRRHLRSEMAEPAYAERQSATAVDPYAFQLSGWLKMEVAKSRKLRRTLNQLHEDLTELGFKGAYDRMAPFARRWWEGPKPSGSIQRTNEQNVNVRSTTSPSASVTGQSQLTTVPQWYAARQQYSLAIGQ